MFTRVYGLLLRRVTFYNSTRFIGITGGVQDFGAELRYWVGEIPRKFQHPLTFFELLSEGLQLRGSLRFYGSTVLRFIFTVRFGGVSVLKKRS